jgi:NADH:ubiquinone oxidoreductase subunit
MNIVDINGNISFNHPLFLLQKAIYDMSRFQENKSDENKMVYALFDMLITINNLFEWTLKYYNEDEEKRKKCIIMFNPYLENDKIPYAYKSDYRSMPSLKPNEAQYIIRKIVNNIKHYEVKVVNTKEGKTNCAQAGQVYAGGFNAFAGYYELTFLVTIKDENNNDISHDLLSLLETLIDKWKSFFEL